MTKKVIFVGVLRNCMPHLNAVLFNMNRLSNLFSEVGYVFIENDSTDNTQQIIKEWGRSKNNFFFVNFDGLAAIPQRGLRLEFARNAYLELIKSKTQFSDFDMMIVMDMDDANIFTINESSVREAINFLYSEHDYAAVFANQLGTYYDMWTLRHELMCNVDVWEEVFDYVLLNNCSDEEAFNATFSNKIYSIKENEPPLEVDSAFGGLGIYKMNFVLKNKNPYLGSRLKILPTKNGEPRFCRFEMCEHVHFNLGIKNSGGRLFIFPKLINGVNFNLKFPSSAYRQFIF